jgi:hypothetical protein
MCISVFQTFIPYELAVVPKLNLHLKSGKSSAGWERVSIYLFKANKLYYIEMEQYEVLLVDNVGPQ